MKIADFPQVQKLSVQEKLLLVEELWDEIAEGADAVMLPEWHRLALDQSLVEYTKNPSEGSSWETVRARILSRQ